MQNVISANKKWKDFFRKKKTDQKPIQVCKQKDCQQQAKHQQQRNIQNIGKIQFSHQKQEKTTENKSQQKSIDSQNKSLVQSKQSQEENYDGMNIKQLVPKKENLKHDVFVLDSTKKVLSILESKQQLLQKQKKINQPKNLSQRQSQPQLNQQKQQQSQQKFTIVKPQAKLARGHYKIFNPQHFTLSTQQSKPSTHRWLYGSGQTPQSLLISSWNVNGIRARMNANDILKYLQFVKPDIFCINEHKMDEKSFNQCPYKFWGYHSYWNFPKYSLGYSGVAIFSKYPAIQMWEDIHIAEHSKQGRVITLEFEKFILVNVYIPTCGRQLERLKYRVEEYDPAFKEYILQKKQQFPTKTFIICGDINVAHKDLDCHTGKRMLQGKQPAFTFQQRSSFTVFLRETKMIDTFRYFHPQARQYTWWNMRRGGRERAGETGIGKRLDYFLVDEKSLKFVKSSEIKKKVKGCDHCPIQMRIQFSTDELQ